MSPIVLSDSAAALESRSILRHKPTNQSGLVLSAWAQGFLTGSIIVMACVTIANMRRGVLLHKLILIELILGVWHGTYIFPDAPVYSWYLSVTALFLNLSWSLHNVIAWMKNKPFLGQKASLFYIGTVILAQPYWVLEIYADFAYFSGRNNIFVYTRPWEALFRDPWWVFTTWSLFYNIRTRYSFTFLSLTLISPRFGILLVSMLLSLAFTLLDILSVTDALKNDLPAGIDPFWELAFVFKLLTDTMILDDFKSALDRLHAFKMAQFNQETRASLEGHQLTTAYSGAGEGGEGRAERQQSSVVTFGDEELEAGGGATSEALAELGDKANSRHLEHQKRPSRDGDES